MNNIQLKLNDINKLSPQERVAGYLLRLARIADLGARLRMKYKDVSTNYLDGWNDEEESKWYCLVDDIEDWGRSLEDDERIIVNTVRPIFDQLTRAEWPIGGK